MATGQPAEHALSPIDESADQRRVRRRREVAPGRAQLGGDSAAEEGAGEDDEQPVVERPPAPRLDEEERHGGNRAERHEGAMYPGGIDRQSREPQRDFPGFPKTLGLGERAVKVAAGPIVTWRLVIL
jgi:hypothetical protein